LKIINSGTGWIAKLTDQTIPLANCFRMLMHIAKTLQRVIFIFWSAWWITLPIAKIISLLRKSCSRSSVYTRASPRTLHNISYPAACRFCDAGFYNRAWVREYNLVTQMRRRNPADDAVLSTAWNVSRKLRQLRRGSEIYMYWLQVRIIYSERYKIVNIILRLNSPCCNQVTLII